jgi:hypothetical protein
MAKRPLPRFHSQKISLDLDNFGHFISEKRTRQQSLAESSLSEYSNSFLQETDRISQIDDSLRGDIDRKYRSSASNCHYVFPRLTEAAHKRTLSQPESKPHGSPLKPSNFQERSMHRLPMAKQQSSSLGKSKSQGIRKLRSHTPQKQRPVMHSHTSSASTFDMMKTHYRSTTLKATDLTSTRMAVKKQMKKTGKLRHTEGRPRASPYKLAATPAKLRVPEKPRLNLLSKSHSRVGRVALLKSEARDPFSRYKLSN